MEFNYKYVRTITSRVAAEYLISNVVDTSGLDLETLIEEFTIKHQQSSQEALMLSDLSTLRGTVVEIPVQFKIGTEEVDEAATLERIRLSAVALESIAEEALIRVKKRISADNKKKATAADKKETSPYGAGSALKEGKTFKRITSPERAEPPQTFAKGMRKRKVGGKPTKKSVLKSSKG